MNINLTEIQKIKNTVHDFYNGIFTHDYDKICSVFYSEGKSMGYNSSIKKIGIVANKGDISIVLLKTITDAIMRSISHEKLFLIAKSILFPLILVIMRKSTVIANRDRVSSILKTRTRKIMARIGHTLVMKPRRP